MRTNTWISSCSANTTRFRLLLLPSLNVDLFLIQEIGADFDRLWLWSSDLEKLDFVVQLDNVDCVLSVRSLRSTSSHEEISLLIGSFSEQVRLFKMLHEGCVNCPWCWFSLILSEVSKICCLKRWIFSKAHSEQLVVIIIFHFPVINPSNVLRVFSWMLGW